MVKELNIRKRFVMIFVLIAAIFMTFCFSSITADAATKENDMFVISGRNGVYATINGRTWQFTYGKWRSTANVKGKHQIIMNGIYIGDPTVTKVGDTYTIKALCGGASGHQGYQCKISMSPSFKKCWTKNFTFKDVSFSNVEIGKTYYVKIRGYDKIKGKRVYDSWSDVKIVKVTR